MPRTRPALAIAVAGVVAGVALVGGAGPARADQVADLISLVQRKPDGMDRDAWRDKRRDAARQLGNSGDPRAVPVLIRVVQTEEFDSIGEIAIEGLGKLGDRRAAPVLRAVLDDPSRDRFTRDAARKALRRLGVPAAAGAESGAGAGSGSGSGAGSGSASGSGSGSGAGSGSASGAGSGSGSGSAASSGTESGGDGSGGGDAGLGGDLGAGDLTGDEGEPGTPPRGPRFASDVLGATDRVTFALGGARFEYDTVREQPTFNGDVSAAWERTRYTETRAYRLQAQGASAAGVVDYQGAGQSSRIVLVDGSGLGEGRLYARGRPVYGLAAASAALSLNYIKVNRPGTGNDTKDTRFGADLSAALGGGFGRVLDVGAALRLHRIEAALRRARALGRPISPDLAERIESMWWAMRGEQGAHDILTYTVAMLRQAGVLLGEPDASLSYQILQVLEDGQLDRRPSGFDVNLGVAESYLVRDSALTDAAANVEDGRAESVFATASYGHQSRDGIHEIVGQGTARYRVLADDGAPSPWSAEATALWRHYYYGRWGDPLGALELGADTALSSDGLMGSDLGWRLAGSLAWAWSPNRASHLRLAATGRWETGELFLGAVFEANYGLLDASFVGSGALPR